MCSWNTNITNIIQAACGYNWCLGDRDLLPYGETLMMELERPPFYISFVSEPTPFPFLVSSPFHPLPHWGPRLPPAASSSILASSSLIRWNGRSPLLADQLYSCNGSAPSFKRDIFSGNINIHRKYFCLIGSWLSI